MGRGDFGDAVRSAIRGVWTGALTRSQGSSALSSAVQEYLREAWYAGARTQGVLPADMTDVERSELQNFIWTQQAFVGRLMRDVYQNRQSAGGKLDPFLSRAVLWEQRYHHAYEMGKQMAGADKKLRWILGATEKHCSDCSRVAGRVHRASIWQKYGWQPGAKALACRGFNCDCRFEETSDPALPGHPPFVRGS